MMDGARLGGTAARDANLVGISRCLEASLSLASE